MTPAELRAWMERHGYTQVQAATVLGVTQQSVSHWLLGKWPIPELAARLVRCLETREEGP